MAKKTVIPCRLESTPNHQTVKIRPLNRLKYVDEQDFICQVWSKRDQKWVIPEYRKVGDQLAYPNSPWAWIRGLTHSDLVTRKLEPNEHLYIDVRSREFFIIAESTDPEN